MERIEVITSVQRRRRYSGQEKAQFVAMTMQPGSSVPSVARQYGISPSLLISMRMESLPNHRSAKVLKGSTIDLSAH